MNLITSAFKKRPFRQERRKGGDVRAVVYCFAALESRSGLTNAAVDPRGGVVDAVDGAADMDESLNFSLYP